MADLSDIKAAIIALEGVGYVVTVRGIPVDSPAPRKMRDIDDSELIRVLCEARNSWALTISKYPDIPEEISDF